MCSLNAAILSIIRWLSCLSFQYFNGQYIGMVISRVGQGVHRVLQTIKADTKII